MGMRSTREYTRAVGGWVVTELGGSYFRTVNGWVVIGQGVGGLYTGVVGGWVVTGQGVGGLFLSSLEVINEILSTLTIKVVDWLLLIGRG